MSFLKSVSKFALCATQSLVAACLDSAAEDKKRHDHEGYWRTQDGELITDPNDVNIQKENAVYLRD
ncbi:hypothetical protein MN202_12285 [Rheinheimera muenzenbergensis]|uniref:Lipoprotein n=1 Tax=Rheinheimera muenzenbergensis TaxID=1193628 RepID=A0ABU8C840_9GAMM